MLDFQAMTTLAASAVTVLMPLLQKALDKGVEEAGKSAATTLIGKLKQRLGHAGAKEALDDVEKVPGDADARAALRVQLRKSLADDPGLEGFLKEWVAAAASTLPAASTGQVANVTGNDNQTTQIIGDGNSTSYGR